MCSWPGGVLEAITQWLGYSKARQLICECRRKPAVCDREVSEACREYWLKPKSRLSFGSEEIICATELLAFSTNKAHRSPFLAMNLVCSLKKPVHRSFTKMIVFVLFSHWNSPFSMNTLKALSAWYEIRSLKQSEPVSPLHGPGRSSLYWNNLRCPVIRVEKRKITEEKEGSWIF